MLGIKTTQLPDKVGEVRERFRKSTGRVIYRMSGYQMAIERASMQRAPRGSYSPAGTAPFTHPRTSKAGNTLPAFPQFIRFKVEEKGFNSRSVVGPTKPSKGRRSGWVERIGRTHEFGGQATVEKRVYYRKAKKDEKGRGLVGYKGRWRSTGLVLFKGKEKTFPFSITEQKKTRGRIVFKIKYTATYPKRPFAAPALRKTVAAARQGKFE